MAQGAHTTSPPRGGRLHDAGGPRDAVPHRKAAQAPLRHRLTGVRAQHRPGLHAAGGMGLDHETRFPRLLPWGEPQPGVSHCGSSLLGCRGLFPARFSPCSLPLQKYPEHAIYKVLQLMMRRGEIQHRMQRKVLYRIK